MSGFILKYSDWRIGFLTIGGAILVVGILVSQILMGKSAPEEYSLYPDGRAPDQCFQDQGCEKIYTERASIWPVIKDAQFWILVFCCSTASLVALMMLVHQVPHALRLGIDNVSATTSLGIVAICGMFGRFFFGWLSDRLKDPKYAAQLGFLIMTAGLVIMSQARSLAGLYLYAVVFGFGYGSIAPLGPVLIAHRFGRQILGSVFGVFSFFWVGLAGIGPLIGGSIFDLTGSYYLAWWVNIVLLMVLIAILFFLKGARSAARR